jgi:dihydrofolate reductase
MSQKIVKVVVAVSSPQGIFGEAGGLAWRFDRPNEDFRRFRIDTGETTGGTVIMGRATWEAIPEDKRPLRGRQNIVVTRNAEYQAPGATVCHSLDEALALSSQQVVSIIGGVSLVKEAIQRKLVHVAHITHVGMDLPVTERTLFFRELLDQKFLYPLVYTSIDRPYVQALESGGTAALSFRRYERGD